MFLHRSPSSSCSEKGNNKGFNDWKSPVTFFILFFINSPFLKKKKKKTDNTKMEKNVGKNQLAYIATPFQAWQLKE